ncbi:hypothetical protein SDA16_15005 [Legionella pneumophila serogroup 1]
MIGLEVESLLSMHYPLLDGRGSDHSLLRTTSDYGRNRAATARGCGNYLTVYLLLYLK